MTVQKIREQAKELRIKNYTRFPKPQLIRAVQAAEGNAPCFKEIHDCWEFGCLWRDECQE
jgi:hypothetical protein